MENKVNLFLLGKKGLVALRSLDQKFGNLISKVVIGEDKNVVNDYSQEIMSFCLEKKIPFFFRRENLVDTSNDNFLIAIGWRWLIKKEKQQSLVVFHDSLLPKYRGFNPLVSALINGESEVGVTCLFGENEFDKGDIIAQETIAINYPIKIQEAIDLIAISYGELLGKVFYMIESGRDIIGVPQEEEKASYSVWRDESDYWIDWSENSETICRVVDALGFPYLGARAKMDGKTVIVDEVEVVRPYKIENLGVGKVLMLKNGMPVVICGTGLIMIKKIRSTSGDGLSFPNKLRYRFTT